MSPIPPTLPVRKITATGVVTTLAGLAGTGGITDGTGSDARFGSVNGIAVDKAGNVYVTDGALTIPCAKSRRPAW